MLADVAAGSEPSALKASTPEPAALGRCRAPGANPCSAISTGRARTPAAVLVLVPGAVEQGKDDPRLVAFANTFARARFAVLVPEIANLRTQQLGPEDAQPIGGGDPLSRRLRRAGGARGLPSAWRRSPTPRGRRCSRRSRRANRDLVGFLTAIGGYYDVEAVITFFTTGYFREGPEAPWRHREPNAYGKWVFVRANAARLAGPADRTALAEIAARKLEDLDADIADLRARLGPEGRAVMALLDNPDPDRVPALIDALPAPIRADLEALDLERRDLSQLPFDLILLHGRDDPIIPSTESQALAAAVPEDRVSLYVLDRLTHIELSPGGLLDGFGLWRAIYRSCPGATPCPPPTWSAACRNRATCSRGRRGNLVTAWSV